jgi:arylsulfatase
MIRDFYPAFKPEIVAEIRRAFYALCTHIDHQLRIVLGTLREEGLLDETVIMVAADHGDMLGDFGLFAKRTYYERSANIPMILAGPPGHPRIPAGCTDTRLVGLQDVMPTLLSLAEIAVPQSCDGIDMLGQTRRSTLYGDCLETPGASRMLHDGRMKLIWYPAGNQVQLFDLETDPREQHDLAQDPAHAETRRAMEERLAEHCYGSDIDQGWVRDGRLEGYDPGPYTRRVDRSFHGQRGLHYPEPPELSPEKSVGFPG